jgi:hypothetical protein
MPGAEFTALSRKLRASIHRADMAVLAMCAAIVIGD